MRLQSSYSRSFANYYNAGRYNMDVSEENKLTASLNLDTEQIKAAYTAGIQDRQENDPTYDRKARRFVNMAQGEKKTGGLGTVSESATEAQKQVATAFGKRTGLEIEITTDTGNENAPASYTNGKLRISPYAKNFNASLSHELTHFIQDYSPDMYQLYRDTAIGAIEKADGIDLETMINKKIAFYEENGNAINRDQAVDEIVADATEKFLNDPDYIDKVVKTNRTLGEKILDFINDVIDALKSLMQTDSTRAESQALERNIELYERARGYWMIGLEEAGDRYQSGMEVRNVESKYQLNQFGLEEYTEKEKDWWRNSNIILANTEEDIATFIRTKVHKKPSSRLYVGKIGTELGQRIKKDTGIDVTNYNIAITSEFENSHSDIKKEASRGQTAVTPELIAKLPEIISSYDQVVVSGETNNGKPALRFEKNLNGKKVAIEYVSDKRKMLTLQTMYAWENKKGNVPTATNAQGPLKTSETLSGMVPNSIIKDLDKKDNIRFQLNKPVEETKNLIAVHNLNEQKLLKTFELEGIPMPSIAIVKSDIGHENFGDISLLFAKDTIDPKKKKNKVYSADAWTPTFPSVEYETNSEIERNITEKTIKANLPEMYNRRLHVIAGSLENYLQTQGNEAGVIDYLKNDTTMKALYLADQGEQITEITKEIKEEKQRNRKY